MIRTYVTQVKKLPNIEHLHIRLQELNCAHTWPEPRIDTDLIIELIGQALDQHPSLRRLTLSGPVRIEDDDDEPCTAGVLFDDAEDSSPEVVVGDVCVRGRFLREFFLEDGEWKVGSTWVSPDLVEKGVRTSV